MRTAKKPLTLSIIIPAYNEEAHIGDCLQAIAKQTEPPDEVIVVDNNSTDKTAAITKSFPFVRLMTEKKQGLRATRSRGVNAARGDIIGRIDADTYLGPEWSATARRLFADPEIMGAVGPAYYHDMPFKRFFYFWDRWIRSALFAINRSAVLFGSNMLFRRSAWEDVRSSLCVEGEFFEDYDLTIHLEEKGYKLVYDPRLKAGVSARRLDDSPREFLHNMSFHTKTFARHGQRRLFASVCRYLYILFYFPGKLIRRFYDPQSQRFSLKKAKQPFAPRPNSNT
ncbi:MAG TPA: glycosyltransferase family 2 protein [Candidatus Limnocylindria bacterium]|nr:glycosyltransferase family 2 protein [Candidatus Limnocylindria bacterium]